MALRRPRLVLGQGRHVALHESGPHRGLERGVEDRVVLLARRRGQPQLGVIALDVERPERLEPDGAQLRLQVLVDDVPVRLVRADRPARRLDRLFEPLVEPLAERLLRGLDKLAMVRVVQQLRELRLGLLPSAFARDPLLLAASDCLSCPTALLSPLGLCRRSGQGADLVSVHTAERSKVDLGRVQNGPVCRMCRWASSETEAGWAARDPARRLSAGARTCKRGAGSCRPHFSCGPRCLLGWSRPQDPTGANDPQVVG